MRYNDITMGDDKPTQSTYSSDNLDVLDIFILNFPSIIKSITHPIKAALTFQLFLILRKLVIDINNYIQTDDLSVS